MGKKKDGIDAIKQSDRSCPTCSAWGNEDKVEFPCAFAKVVVVRAHPRENCRFWRAAR